jgi:hypothetical protein
MTKKRDLKRRVRERQAETGESYTAALHRVRALVDPGASGEADGDGEGDGEGEAEAEAAVPVLALDELDELAARLGLKCRVSMFPSLRGRIDPEAALVRLREVLGATEQDPALDVLRAAVMRGEQRSWTPSVQRVQEAQRFVERARAGIGGVSTSGSRIAMQLDGRDGPEMVIFTLWLRPTVGSISVPPALIIGAPDDFAGRLPGYQLR